jgi:glycerate kinase
VGASEREASRDVMPVAHEAMAREKAAPSPTLHAPRDQAADRVVPHVVIAPDKFKGSATASEVAGHIAAGIRSVIPDLRITALPVADGGEGTVDAAAAAGFARHETIVAGPLGDPVRAVFALRAGTAVVELAQASGISVLPGGRPAPLHAGTRGTGELIRAALDAGARTVVLGVGGSASTDGGAGMLAALGARFLDAEGRDLAGGGGALPWLAAADLGGLDPRLSRTSVVLASDVDNPLLGAQGAAAVFGPQKGAGPADVTLLGAGLEHFVNILSRTVGPAVARAAAAPGAGAAGGAGFGALALLGAVRRSGIEVLLEVLGFERVLADADLVVTGEGCIDEQTLRGKAPAGVANAARRSGVPVAAVCGRQLLTVRQLESAGFAAAYTLADIEPDAARSIAHPGPPLEQLGARLAADLLCGPGRSCGDM